MKNNEKSKKILILFVKIGAYVVVGGFLGIGGFYYYFNVAKTPLVLSLFFTGAICFLIGNLIGNYFSTNLQNTHNVKGESEN